MISGIAVAQETVALKTVNIYTGDANLARLILTKRIAHIQKLCAEADSLKASSYVGREMSRIETLLAANDLPALTAMLDRTEKRLKSYGLWKDDDSYTVVGTIDDVIGGSTTNAP